MSSLLGTTITGMVTDKNEKNVFVQKDGVTFKVVDGDTETIEIGDMISGFAYVNQKNEHVLMTEIPSMYKGVYGWGEVVGVQHDLGVFVDVGWEGKDLAVSLDDLPVFSNVWPRKGDRLFLTVDTDDKDRMWGKFAPIDDIIADAVVGTKEMHNSDIKGTVISSFKVGSYVALDDGYLGFVHPNERDEEPRLGQLVSGRVIGLRDDGILYMSLMPRAHEALDDDAAMLLEVMKRSADNRIPYHDKSNPDEIRTYFGISKGQFKRAVGRLMKERLALQDKEGTYLTEEGINREL